MIEPEQLTAGLELIPLRVNDLKQFEYCPRIVFYNTVMPLDRKVTFKMHRGTEAEFKLDALEKRRSLRRYKLAEGDRQFHVWLHSERLGLSGKMDMLVISPEGCFPVDFKYTRGRPHRNHIAQLAAYAVLVEEHFQTQVNTGFIYLAPIEELVAVQMTTELKGQVALSLEQMRKMIHEGILPEPTPVRARCQECEFRNYCGDIF
jgi:CRISPR-associated exonuclease Cas4